MNYMDELVYSPEKEPFERDEEEVAILDPKDWKLLELDYFPSLINLKTLTTVTVANAICPAFPQRSALTTSKIEKQTPPRKLTLVKNYSPQFTQQLCALDFPEKIDVFHTKVGLGGYQFGPLLPKNVCTALCKEAQQIAQDCGLPLNHMGLHVRFSLPHIWTWLKTLVQRIESSIVTLHPDARLELQSAFFVRYNEGESHKAHADKTDLTINICLERSQDGKGGELRLEPDHPDCVDIPHIVGSAIAHFGRQTHETRPSKGGRTNLIIWCKVQASLPFWSKLPLDIRNTILSGVDSTTLAAYCCCSRATSASVPATIWQKRLETEFPELKKDAAIVHKERKLSYHALYGLAYKQKALDTIIQSLSTGIQRPIMKETWEMAMERERKEKEDREQTTIQLFNELPSETFRLLQQRLAATTIPSTTYPWFLPPFTHSPLTKFVKIPEANQLRSPFPAPNLLPTTEPNPVISFFSNLFGLNKPQSLMPPILEPEAFDTNGVRLNDFPWFWPRFGIHLPSFPKKKYIRWFVTPWNQTLAITIIQSNSTSWIGVDMERKKCNPRPNELQIKASTTLLETLEEFQKSSPTARYLRYPFFPLTNPT